MGAPAELDGRGRRRATLLLALACDNRCLFCAQEGLPPHALGEDALGGRLPALRAAGFDALTFVGGEPALVPWLPRAVAAACAAGFARVGLQTNGRATSAPGALDRLSEAGLTDLHLSIHGAVARVHDYQTGVPGSFASALATLAAARRLGLPAAVTTVVTRSSFRVLGDLPRLLRSRGAAAWQLAFPADAGRAAESFDRVLPRLALAVPFVLHALEAALRLGLPAFVSGAPLCLLGPFASRALAAPAASFGPACEACAARPRCPGVPARYLARFDGDELRPRGAEGPRAAGREDDLASLFVGTGEAAPPPGGDVPPSPARAREALKSLGRVRPAPGEAPRSAPRRDGESLKALFPNLYEPAEGEGPDGTGGGNGVRDAKGVAAPPGDAG